MPRETRDFHAKTYRAPVNDQWDFLLSTMWNQMIHLVIIVDGRLDEERLFSAMCTALATEPVLRCRFIGSPVPCWEELPAVPPGTFFSVVQADDAKKALRHALFHRVDPCSGPQARLTLIRGREDVLVLSVNHAASDACGVKGIAALIARAYRGSAPDSAPDIPPSPACDRSYAPVLSSFTQQEQEMAREACKESPAEWGVPCSPGPCRAPCYLWRRIDRGLFGRVRSFSRSERMTINDLLLSAFFQSVSMEIPHSDGRDYPVLTSLDLRRLVPGVSTPAVANLSVAFEVRLPADSTLPPYSHARETHHAMEERKRLLAGIGAAVRVQEKFEAGFSSVRQSLEDLARASESEAYPRNPFFSNTGIIPAECTDFGGMEASCAFLVPPLELSPGFSVAASTFEDTLTLASGFYRDSISPFVVRRILCNIERTLLDITR